MHFPVEPKDGDGKKGHRQKGDRREPRMEVHHRPQTEAQQEKKVEELGATEGKEEAKRLHIGRQPGHEIAGLGVVVKPEGKGLQLPIEGVPELVNRPMPNRSSAYCCTKAARP